MFTTTQISIITFTLFVYSTVVFITFT